MYEQALQHLRDRHNAPKPGAGAVMSPAEREQAAMDYYASVRTNVSRAGSPCVDVSSSFFCCCRVPGDCDGSADVRDALTRLGAPIVGPLERKSHPPLPADTDP